MQRWTHVAFAEKKINTGDRERWDPDDTEVFTLLIIGTITLLCPHQLICHLGLMLDFVKSQNQRPPFHYWVYSALTRRIFVSNTMDTLTIFLAEWYSIRYIYTRFSSSIHLLAGTNAGLVIFLPVFNWVASYYWVTRFLWALWVQKVSTILEAAFYLS